MSELIIHKLSKTTRAPIVPCDLSTFPRSTSWATRPANFTHNLPAASRTGHARDA